MKKIVYLIGAGFSAPLGIPTMKDFFQVSRKLEIASRPHFKNVFDYWERSSHVKNYSKINMLNIEELLSLIEMEEFLGNTKLSSDIRQYIADVVNHFEVFNKPLRGELVEEVLPSNWYKLLFNGPLINNYGYFFLGLINKSIQPSKNHELWQFKINDNLHADTDYSIISLNYDMVFENVEDIFLRKLGQETTTKILCNDISKSGLKFIKLHGSADRPESIISPTWNKINSLERKTEWISAYSLLANADEIRVLGYSMPKSDTYSKYFLMTCLKDSSRIEKFSVICLDDREKNVYKNYRDFFDDDLNMLSFIPVNIEGYLECIVEDLQKRITNDVNNNVKLPTLENGHYSFIKSIK